MSTLEQTFDLDEDVIKANKLHKKEIVLKSRKKHIEKYNATCLAYYNKKKTDEEWRLRRNEKCKINMRRYNEKKKLKLALLSQGTTVVEV
jgi:hypothetical protein